MIARAPDDQAGYLVYADWLQQHGDPRGELIALQCAGKRKQADKLLAHRAAHFLGDLAVTPQRLLPYPYGALGRTTTWRWGYLEAVWLSRKTIDGDAPTVADALDGLLHHPSAAFVRELTIGIVAYSGNSYDEIAKVIGKHELPTLKRLVIGDFYSGGDRAQLERHRQPRADLEGGAEPRDPGRAQRWDHTRRDRAARAARAGFHHRQPRP